MGNRPGEGLRVKGVGLDDVGSSLEVFPVDGAHDLRSGQTEEVIIALQRMWKIPEAIAAVTAFVETIPLDHGSHGPVDDEDTLLQCSFNRMHNRSGSFRSATREKKKKSLLR